MKKTKTKVVRKTQAKTASKPKVKIRAKTFPKPTVQLGSKAKIVSQAISLAKSAKKTVRTRAKKGVSAKELVPVAVALAAISLSVLAPRIVKMARAFGIKRQEKIKAKRLSLGRSTAAAREVKNRITAAPNRPLHTPHQTEKKGGAVARRNHKLKKADVLASTIRKSHYSRFDHSQNR